MWAGEIFQGEGSGGEGEGSGGQRGGGKGRGKRGLGTLLSTPHVKNPVNLSKKYFFSIKLLHAHFQYVCNISAKC